VANVRFGSLADIRGAKGHVRFAPVLRAVLTGQPFDMLKPEHYESWKGLELTFDPKDM
jgi:hypothetical protein